MTALTLSPLGSWMGRNLATPELVAHLESHGYGAVWIGGSPSDPAVLAPLLEAGERIVIATGVVNIWSSTAEEVAAGALGLLERWPDRFLLGIGAGHPERNPDAARPYEAVVRYLDALDAAGVPRDRVALAALGPRMLRLAGERTAGAHPYLTTPAHTALARDELGAGPLLVPEQRAVLRVDAEGARAIGRPSVATPYLTMKNYRNSLLRLGYAEEELETGSDRLVDELVAWGDDAAVAARLREHLAAGADQVAVQLLGPEEERLDGFARVAAAFAASGTE